MNAKDLDQDFLELISNLRKMTWTQRQKFLDKIGINSHEFLNNYKNVLDTPDPPSDAKKHCHLTIIDNPDTFRGYIINIDSRAKKAYVKFEGKEELEIINIPFMLDHKVHIFSTHLFIKYEGKTEFFI